MGKVYKNIKDSSLPEQKQTLLKEEGPESLTVKDLKQLLKDFDVEFVSSSRKAVLVDLVQDKVLPQLKSIDSHKNKPKDSKDSTKKPILKTPEPEISEDKSPRSSKPGLSSDATAFKSPKSTKAIKSMGIHKAIPKAAPKILPVTKADEKLLKLLEKLPENSSVTNKQSLNTTHSKIVNTTPVPSDTNDKKTIATTPIASKIKATPKSTKIKTALQSNHTIPQKRTLEDSPFTEGDSDFTNVYQEYSRVTNKSTNYRDNFSSSPAATPSTPYRSSHKKSKPNTASLLQEMSTEEVEVVTDTSMLDATTASEGTPIKNNTNIKQLGSISNQNDLNAIKAQVQSSPFVSQQPVTAPLLPSSTPMKDDFSRKNLKRRAGIMPPLSSLNVSKSFANKLRIEQEHSLGESTPKGPQKSLTLEKEPLPEKVESIKVDPTMKFDEVTTDRLKIRTPDISSDDEEILKTLQEEFELEDKKIQEEARQVLQQINNNYSSYFSISTIRKLMTAWFIALFAFYGFTCYREKRIQVGFCGEEINRPIFNYDRYKYPLISPYTDAIEEAFKLECIPCPPHGECYSYSRLQCDPDYTKLNPWYSGFGLIPTYSVCVLDSVKLKKIDRIVKEVTDLLSRRNAELKCGEGDDEDAGLTILHLQNYLAEKFELNGSSSDDYSDDFEYLWDKAYQILITKPELVFIELEDDNRLVRSHSKSRLSLKCKLKKVFVKTLLRLKYPIMCFAAVSTFVGIITFKIKNYRRQKQLINKSIKDITVKVIKKLQEQAKSHHQTGHGLPFIAKIQLRDYYINIEPELTDKSKSTVWDKVVRNVERNSNIKSYQCEVRGDIMVVWEWISAI